MFDPAAGDLASPEVASMAVWFDAFVQNVDRTARNANLLVWHRSLQFIDHGAALFFHHNWETAERKVESPFAEIRQHLLLPWASSIKEAAQVAQTRLSPDLLRRILSMVPNEWLGDGPVEAEERRAAYLAYLSRRLAASSVFEQEAANAYQHVL